MANEQDQKSYSLSEAAAFLRRNPGAMIVEKEGGKVFDVTKSVKGEEFETEPTMELVL